MHTLDYRQPEVREHYLALIRELITDYSFDVLELDFLRHPPYFPPDNTEEHRGLMTEFVREIRRLLDRPEGDKRLLVRVPDTAAVSYDLGLDLKTWAREGLIDGVAASAFCHTGWQTEVDEFRRLLGDEVAFYPGAELIAGNPERFSIAEDQSKDPHTIHAVGRAENAWICGCLLRPVEQTEYICFNFFCPRDRNLFADNEPKFEVLGELSDPAKLRGKPKTYILNCRWERTGSIVEWTDQIRSHVLWKKVCQGRSPC